MSEAQCATALSRGEREECARGIDERERQECLYTREREECVRGIVSNSSVDVRQLSQSSPCQLTCMHSLLELCVYRLQATALCMSQFSANSTIPVQGHRHPQDLCVCQLTAIATRKTSPPKLPPVLLLPAP